MTSLLEIDIKKLKEDIVFDLQLILSYNQIKNQEALKFILSILSETDCSEIAEEKNANGVCASLNCLKNSSKKFFESSKGTGYFCCSDSCSEFMTNLFKSITKIGFSHQSTPLTNYIEILNLLVQDFPHLNPKRNFSLVLLDEMNKIKNNQNEQNEQTKA